jgi:hypothetical protein
VHRVRSLDPRDHGRLHDIAVTSLARTLLDLAEILSPRRLARVIEEAERLHLFDLTEIRETIERSNGRRGAASLLAICGAEPESQPLIAPRASTSPRRALGERAQRTRP